MNISYHPKSFKIVISCLVCLGVHQMSEYRISFASTRTVPVPHAMMTIPGILLVADRPVLGGKIYLLAASAGVPGSPSQSLIGASLHGNRDEIGSYVSADEHGGFAVTQSIPCPPSALIYVYERGGHRYGRPENPLIGLLSLVGTCSSSGVIKPYTGNLLLVTERTTAEAAFSMKGYGPDPTHITMSRFQEPADRAGR